MNQLLEITKLYEEALSKEISDYKIYTGDIWYYNPNVGQYMSSKDNYILSKQKYGKHLFRNKIDARKFQKYRKELLRLISIYTQQRIENFLNEIEDNGVNHEVVDVWRKDLWYGRE